MDSYNANVAEMLVIMNLGKQAISFGMGFGLLDWVLQHGYATIVAGAFTAVLCVDTFAVLPFWFFGRRLDRLLVWDDWLGCIKEVLLILICHIRGSVTEKAIYDFVG